MKYVFFIVIARVLLFSSAMAYEKISFPAPEVWMDQKDISDLILPFYESKNLSALYSLVFKTLAYRNDRDLITHSLEEKVDSVRDSRTRAILVLWLLTAYQIRNDSAGDRSILASRWIDLFRRHIDLFREVRDIEYSFHFTLAFFLIANHPDVNEILLQMVDMMESDESGKDQLSAFFKWNISLMTANQRMLILSRISDWKSTPSLRNREVYEQLQELGRQAPQTKNEFCSLVQDGPRAFQELLYFAENRNFTVPNELGFKLGEAYLGDCWWRSRFLRNASFLVYFAPAEKKPTQQEYRSILRKIIKGREIVKVPGFANLNAFTEEDWTIVQHELRAWMRRSTWSFQFLRGLQGASHVRASRLKLTIEELYRKVHDEGRVVYQMEQLKGFGAHSHLVVHMIREGNSYEIWSIDPLLGSFKGLTYFKWSPGMTSVTPYDDFSSGEESDPFVPFTQFESELDRLIQIGRKFCDVKVKN